MKVILLSASPRRGGNTDQVLEACAEVIRKEGVEAEILSLAGRDVKSCIACPNCDKQPDCVIDDGANALFSQIGEADGFIVGTPVYFGTARGDLLSFLQRLGRYSKKHGRFLEGVVGGPIAIARRGGQTATLQELLMFYMLCGMIVPGSSYWNMLFGHFKGEAVKDEEGMAAVLKFAKKVAFLVKKLRC